MSVIIDTRCKDNPFREITCEMLAQVMTSNHHHRNTNLIVIEINTLTKLFAYSGNNLLYSEHVLVSLN